MHTAVIMGDLGHLDMRFLRSRKEARPVCRVMHLISFHPDSRRHAIVLSSSVVVDLALLTCSATGVCSRTTYSEHCVSRRQDFFQFQNDIKT